MNIELSSTGAAYVRYATSASATNLFVGGDENSEVIADLDESGNVIVIEILDVTAGRGDHVEFATRKFVKIRWKYACEQRPLVAAPTNITPPDRITPEDLRRH
ncbi:MAG: hypothetical protein ACLPYS_04875 [Vulcanimicrobiaceae bacterium]